MPRLFDRDVNGMISRLSKEKNERHARFGDTVYLLEPNVKNGQGGYRDLLVGLWAAKARFRVADFADLVTAGQASPRQVQALVDARRFYLEVRTASHFARKRKAGPADVRGAGGDRAAALLRIRGRRITKASRARSSRRWKR